MRLRRLGEIVGLNSGIVDKNVLMLPEIDTDSKDNARLLGIEVVE